MKNKRWSLEVKLLSGIGVNQVKLSALMGDFKEEDENYFNESIRGLIEAGEVKEYKENVVLKLGEFEGSTKEEAYGNYFESFDGDDQNELFFMNQVEAIELAVPCGCGGNCHTADNLDKLREGMKLIDAMTEEHRMDYLNGSIPSLLDRPIKVDNTQALNDAINRGEVTAIKKVSVYKEARYKIQEGSTIESVLDDLNSGKWRSWERDAKDTETYLEDTEEDLYGEGTVELYTTNNSKIGNN